MLAQAIRIHNDCCCVDSVYDRALIIGVDDSSEAPASEANFTGDAFASSGMDPALLELLSGAMRQETHPDVISEVEPSEDIFLEVEYGQEFIVTLKKEPGSVFGAKVVESARSSDITVKSIGPGLLQNWNDAFPDERVEPGDKMVAVNGIRGPTAAAMMNKLRTEEEEFELVFVRCRDCVEEMV